jgi:glucosamine--fructose-6-phosphate aminotransferase (isomerizing)
LDWSAALPTLETASHLYVVGRGLGLGAAQETALKCKETCGLHAEAFSSAELRHGPYALLGSGFPALLFAQRDATQAGVDALAVELARRGVPVLMAGAQDAGPAADGVRGAGAIVLPTIPATAEIAPLLLVQSAYRLIATLAVRRGFDPDHPAHLRKVTETV